VPPPELLYPPDGSERCLDEKTLTLQPEHAWSPWRRLFTQAGRPFYTRRCPRCRSEQTRRSDYIDVDPGELL
jgi:hypothetical protein